MAVTTSLEVVGHRYFRMDMVITLTKFLAHDEAANRGGLVVIG
jgi:hypothetical protein